MMHLASGFLISALVAVMYAQNSTPSVPVQVRHLTIISGSLPEVDRERIVHGLQGGRYGPEELAERVRQYLRNSGYYNAQAGDPQLFAVEDSQGGRCADCTLEVNPGALYTLGEIVFEDTKVFTPDRLRSQFPSKTGEHFNSTEIGRGLENLRDLYASKGYVNFGAIPKAQVDEARHIVRLVIDVDEGNPVSFGNLRLEGMEPVAGAAKSLLVSWKDLQGKLYSPELMKIWLATKTSDWPHEAAAQVHTEYLAAPFADSAIDVMLHFQ